MKAAYLQLKVEKKELVSFVTLEPQWVEHILNKDFDLVLYVDLWETVECKNGKAVTNQPAVYKPITWIVQTIPTPYSSGGISIAAWLPIHFDKGNDHRQGGNYFWFTNFKEKKDCSQEIRNFLVDSGVEVIDVDIRQVKNTTDIDAVLAKL